MLLAQFRKLPQLLQRLRTNKKRYKELISDLPGLRFREITDEQGECATMLTVILPSAGIAQSIARDLGTKVVARAGWHVYNNMEQLMKLRTATAVQCPFSCFPIYAREKREIRYTGYAAENRLLIGTFAQHQHWSIRSWPQFRVRCDASRRPGVSGKARRRVRQAAEKYLKVS